MEALKPEPLLSTMTLQQATHLWKLRGGQMLKTDTSFGRKVRIQILLGSLIWGIFLFLPLESGNLRPIAALLLLAFFVVFPLGLSLSLSSEPSIPFKVALFLQPFAAFVAAISFFLPKGVISGTFAIVWLPVMLFTAWNGLQIIQRQGIRKLLQNPAELCFVVAQVYVPVGAIWFLASRLGLELLGFAEPIILLTAIHFHFAGFAAPILAGLVGRQLDRQTNNPFWKKLYFVVAGIVMLGPALVAIGITLSPVVEAVAGAVLAFGYTGLAVIILGHTLAGVQGLLPRLFLGISALSAMVTMVAAAAYALRTFNLLPFLSIPQMVAIHGWGNAVGFVFCGLLGWGLNRKSATIA